MLEYYITKTQNKGLPMTKQIHKLCISAIVASALLSTSLVAEEKTPEPKQEQAVSKEATKVEIAEGIKVDQKLISNMERVIRTQGKEGIQLKRFFLKEKIALGEIKPELKDWSKVVFEITFFIEAEKREQTVYDSYIVNEKIGLLSRDLSNYKTNTVYASDVKSDLSKDIYKNDSHHLIAGNKDAKHKIVVFSNPLCGICRDVLPEIKAEAIKSPSTFALYHYAIPSQSLPNSDILIRIATVLLSRGGDAGKITDAIYSTDTEIVISATQETIPDILKAVAKKMGTKDLDITMEDLTSAEVGKIMDADIAVAMANFVRGTPTVYFDGKYDKMRNEYKKYIDNSF